MNSFKFSKIIGGEVKNFVAHTQMSFVLSLSVRANVTYNYSFSNRSHFFSHQENDILKITTSLTSFYQYNVYFVHYFFVDTKTIKFYNDVKRLIKLFHKN